MNFEDIGKFERDNELQTVKLRIKEPVNFEFRLKWFLYNGYLERNETEVLLKWFLFLIVYNA